MLIPQAALIADQQGVYVFVVEDGKAVSQARSRPAASSGTDVVVDEGLTRRRAGHRRGPAERAAGRRGARNAGAARRQPELIRCSPPSSSTGRGSPSSSRSSRRSPGLLSLFAIPIAQYPDIVPPQVSVTTTYPGASAAVVDATVAQPIEAQVVGVDKMIYMKSVSGDDGSYTLTVSFELGTDPDINTVNVNNRVQIALSSLPQDVQRQGVTVKKKSSALLGVIAVYSPKHTHDPLFISNYVTINLLDPIKSTPGVGDATLLGAAGLCDARLGAHRPADRPQSDHRRHHQRHPGAERAGRGRPHRRAADLQRPAAAAQHPDQGPADLGRGIRATSSSAPIPTARCCGSAMSRGSSSAPPISTARRGSTAGRPSAIAIYQSPGANAIADPEGRHATASPSSRSASPRISPGRSPTTRPSSSPRRSTRCRRR